MTGLTSTNVLPAPDSNRITVRLGNVVSEAARSSVTSYDVTRSRSNRCRASDSCRLRWVAATPHLRLSRMEPRSGPSRPIRMTRTLMLTLAAAGMLLSGCGQQPSAPPTQAPEALVGCTQTQSKAAARKADEVPAEVDLDGDGSPDKVLLTRDDAACPGVLFTTVKDRRYSAKVRDPAGLDLTSATRVSLPGREGDLLALRAEHPRGGFQVQVYAFDDTLGEVTADGQPVVPFVATDTTAAT